jgi:mRNA-degrading endonuclease RelE of RelBE toxin-antitoxin system
MPFELLIHKQAEKQLLKIFKEDRKLFEKINHSIVELKDNLYSSRLWIKKLQGRYKNFFCIKINSYRIKFGVENGHITIYEIEPRKDAYR